MNNKNNWWACSL